MEDGSIIEKLGINTKTKIIEEERWNGCCGCLFFTIDKEKPIFCGIPRHTCCLGENDPRRDCHEYKIIYKEWPLSDKEKIFNEMLEALIKIEEYTCKKGCRDEYKKEICGNCSHAENKRIIEKATDKTWPEIKELK